MATADEALDSTLEVADADRDEALLPPIRFLTDEEWMAKVDRAARHHLGMSGEEFARAWKAGQFDNDPDQPGVMRVAMMLSFGK
ncbi:MAG: hypothetical protein H0V51_11515 [Chloroflexi bacterium]|nr:hypothetical protein [Chloroflexota bacterium]